MARYRRRRSYGRRRRKSSRRRSRLSGMRIGYRM